MKEISKTNKKETVYKNTVYAKMRKKLFDSVSNGNQVVETQWDEQGRCQILKTFGDRGVIATMQRKANNKGWVVFFTLSIFKKENNNIPFLRDIKIRLTINETPSGVKLLWFVNNKPQWGMECYHMAYHMSFYRTGSIIQEVIWEIHNIYPAEKFMPILKYMQEPGYVDLTVHGLTMKWINRLSNGTNPKDILNKNYGKYGQHGLSKNAFGSVKNINTFATLVVASEIARCLKSFPTSFFDKIILKPFEFDLVAYEGLNRIDVGNIQYFVKYFNHNKIQQDFINQINNFIMQLEWTAQYEETDHRVQRFFNATIWRDAADSGRMLKEIKNRSIRRNIIAFKGTFDQTHDLITVEHAKISRQEKKIKYNKQTITLDNQQVTDNIISVLPKTTTDLVLWGSQQHNCIGSYGDRVASGKDTMIVGFKDVTTGAWVGHVELNNHFTSFGDCWMISQLRGKHNNQLNQPDDNVIRMFIKEITDRWDKEYASINARWEALP